MLYGPEYCGKFSTTNLILIIMVISWLIFFTNTYPNTLKESFIMIKYGSSQYEDILQHTQINQYNI